MTQPLALFALAYDQERTIRRAISFSPRIGAALLTVPVEWSFHLRSSAGSFHSRPCRITLHPDLQRQGQQAIVDTFLHETAHAIQWMRYSRVDHLDTWHEAMYQLGAKPVRCHKMNLQTASLAANASVKELDL